MKATIVLLFACVTAQLFGAPNVKILQVEEPRDNTFCFADSVIPAGVAVTKDPLISMFPNPSQHATDVAARLLSHPENISEIEINHSGTYWGRSGLGMGRSQYSGDVEIYPKPTHGQLVENHSYGMMDLFSMADGLVKIDRRVERDNVVVVVAVPDSGMAHVASPYGDIEIQLPNMARNIIAVGSGRGYHEVFPGGRLDLVTDEDWTSYGAPKVAEVAAAMISETLSANKTYRWNEVRDVLVQSGDPTNVGAPRLNRDRALAQWRALKGIGQVTPPPVAPKVLVPPTISSFSGPTQVLTPNESATVTWVTNGAQSVTLDGLSVNLSGSSTVASAIGATNHVLTATNADGSVSQTVTVTYREFTDDEKRTQCALIAGATYSNGVFSVPAGAVHVLDNELRARGL